MGWMLPEFSIKSAGSWFGTSVCIDRMTADLVDALGQPWVELADLDAAGAVLFEPERRAHELAAGLPTRLERVRGGLAVMLGEPGLGVEGIDVRRPAVHEQEDDMLG